MTVIDEGPPTGADQPAPAGPTDQQIRAAFQLPKAVTILGRSSSVTNSFVNSIIPVVVPTTQEIGQALATLGMSETVTCAYCGDPWTEWDHLRPIVIDQQPTGYIHEIHNLVPACGKCNQSKGNKPWQEWMFGDAAKSPKTRGISDIDERAARLQAYEESQAPTKLDLAQIVGAEEWHACWVRWKDLMVQMRAATEHAARIKALVARTQIPGGDSGTLPFEDNDIAPTSVGPDWIVRGPQGAAGPLPKNRAVLETVRALVDSGVTPESLVALLGSSHFRSVDGTLTGDQLWDAFAQNHQRTEGQRRLWFLDAPIHDGHRTWVLSNNVWGRHTYQLFKDLVTCTDGTVTVTQPNGVDVKRHGTGEGMRVLKAGEPIPAKKSLPSRPASGWLSHDQDTLDRLAVAESRWVSAQPTDGFGSATLAAALALTERGFDVRPFDVDELADEEVEALEPASLLATTGTRRLAVFTDDYGQPDTHRWARLKERIGPYRETPVLDRALADFSVHGPFERDVTRHNQQVWVTVSVRLGDVDTALLDLTNVAAGLDSALRSVSNADFGS
ncbi:HNH endonuclease [Nocardioides sp. zg-ZUI104]|uniref:HNH endonuclease signature motif containing protein n=1 Tax=Nocardioides faecalis TaxID=2803858 RepID=UPI001BD140FD|nr:HNH endonuclease [Nocardioides faecalis]MBS4753234.1 HNH endonuclease [Nocardioides faecalis]